MSGFFKKGIFFARERMRNCRGTCLAFANMELVFTSMLFRKKQEPKFKQQKIFSSSFLQTKVINENVEEGRGNNNACNQNRRRRAGGSDNKNFIFLIQKEEKE